jgi:glucosylceramidase
LGPAFRTAGLNTKIIVWDHNCDLPQYPETILNDAEARRYVDGSAFHLYNGDISALTAVHDLHPDRNLYFTEQWTSSKGDFAGDLNWHTRHVIIGSMRNWSRTALEWNLANDAGFGPHTVGGCTECKGALTINGNTVIRNVSYYIVAQASTFVPAGSVRIASTQSGSLSTAAFLTPTGSKVLIVGNDGAAPATFNLLYKGKRAAASLPPSSVATYVW